MSSVSQHQPADPNDRRHTDLGRKPGPGRVKVTLHKVSGVIGAEPVGATYSAVVPADGDEYAHVFRRLKRDLPAENPLCWERAGDPEASR